MCSVWYWKIKIYQKEKTSVLLSSLGIKTLNKTPPVGPPLF